MEQANDSTRWLALRAWLWFVASMTVMLGILVWARPFTDGTLTAWLASATAVLLRVAGIEANTRGTLLVTSLGTVEIVRECTGVYPTALYIAAVLAFPTDWVRKLRGIVLGVVAIQVVNLVRIISLLLVHRFRPDVFEVTHLVVWQSVMLFLIVIFWILWSSEVVRSRKRDAA